MFLLTQGGGGNVFIDTRGGGNVFIDIGRWVMFL